VEPSLDLSLSHGDFVIKINCVLLLPLYILVLKINILCMLLVKMMSYICCLLYIP
jgi:hypothetical protein